MEWCSLHKEIAILFCCSCLQPTLVKTRTVLTNLTSDMWTPEHDNKINNFITDKEKQLLMIFIDEQNRLTICDSLPTFEVQELMYFAREVNAVVTPENFSSVVQFGMVRGSHVDTLLRAMHSLYAPTFFEHTAWPDSILYY